MFRGEENYLSWKTEKLDFYKTEFYSSRGTFWCIESMDIQCFS